MTAVRVNPNIKVVNHKTKSENTKHYVKIILSTIVQQYRQPFPNYTYSTDPFIIQKY